MIDDTGDSDYRDECQSCYLVTEIMYCSLCSERLCMDCMDTHAEDCSEFHDEEDPGEYELAEFIVLVKK